jgi:GR25 family glycosyltransferase involved in LPS biosynthesis
VIEHPTIEPASAIGGRPALWDGYFINLDRSPERRLRIEQQLQNLGLSEHYTRFRAIDGRALNRDAPIKPGEVGIYRSHLDLLQRIAASGRLGHVLEDDAVLCDLTAPAIESAVGRLGTRFDILFTETFVQDSVPPIRFYLLGWHRATKRGPIKAARQLQIADLTMLYLGGMTSYVITPQGAAKLASALGHDWANGPTAPVDLIVRREIQSRRLRAFCIVPFVTTFDLAGKSLAERDCQDEFVLLRHAIRYAFYVRRDLTDYAAPLIDRTMSRLAPSENDPALEFNARILRYLLMLT